MENREDLRSILPFLPLKLNSSTLSWPNQVIEALKSLSKGPSHSRVDSGEVLFLAISDLRNSLSLSSHPFANSAADGYALFFDEFLSRAEAAKWFGEVVPLMANLLLRFPAFLESHYQYADLIMVGVDTGLRLLEPQQPGIVFLSQELIAALLSCSFFCLFPTANRVTNHLPVINFDRLFASLYEKYHENLEHKIKCIVHYFERIHSSVPVGYVSFERKVLVLENNAPLVTYPTANLWAKSVVPLCLFEVCSSGLIEDQLRGALEVDFANKYLGGGALSRGCVQEEIRFMINPELIAGMLFLPSMSDNEAIETVGAERFSNYSGYASTFRYAGNHVDIREIDSFGRRKTIIVAIDALRSPGLRQYRVDSLLREVNKAFCGFLDQLNYQQYQMLLQYCDSCVVRGGNDPMDADVSDIQATLVEDSGMSPDNNEAKATQNVTSQMQVHHSDVGIATGNWGCGAFGGDPELKSVIQWLAASQVCKWIMSHNWTVGDLWNMLVDYSSKRAKGETNLGFFSWLLPC
ncbi:poly(ADP-ribose) glycohydrolase 1 isoform X2 [Beta vulgaris subsp. vulgaris]|uniref:poly(ADP-ribose) glycohydrolase 1 isoform X2 n=1 Tax=Beta vulgaris subsp. vulgaris TaxID=3555 RepID=UPI002037031E|nr:poly(ADP-ribose) glycohydrolase 1 isoform X2 [Beta vulgaris subsp. vulgaris]